jgi:hypothetical protein
MTQQLGTHLGPQDHWIMLAEGPSGVGSCCQQSPASLGHVWQNDPTTLAQNNIILWYL